MTTIKRFLNCWWLFLRTGMRYDTDNDIMVYVLLATIYMPVLLVTLLLLVLGQMLRCGCQ